MGARARSRTGIVVLVLAGLLLPVAVVATWTASTVTDTDAFVARVGPVAREPEVQALVSTQLADRVAGAVIDDRVAPQVTEAIDELSAPEPVKGLLRDVAASLGGAVEARVQGVAETVVAAPEFRAAFDTALGTAHSELVATLEGDTAQGAVVAEGSTVSIRLATVGNAVRAELVSAGYTFVDRIPTLEASVPIATVDQLERWQGWYGVLSVLVWLGPLLVVLLAAAGAWLRRDLAVSATWFAASALLTLVAVVAGVRVAIGSATSGIADPLARDAARAVVATLTSSLTRNATAVGLVLLVVLAVAAYVAAQRRLTRRDVERGPAGPAAPATAG